MTNPLLASLLLAWSIVADPVDLPAGKPFAIRVVDEATGRGVPLVELRTVDATRFVTDNAGLVAFDELGLMSGEVFFEVRAHGYDVPADGFGYRGVRLKPVPGGEATVRLTRRNVAERLYRVTGSGLYRDSLLLARPTPLASPAINGRVVGQDSVVNGLCNGTLYWFWGDTNRPSYPLGNYHVPGATSRLPAEGGLDPDVGVDLTYFVDAEGFARPTAKLPGAGPTWIFGVAVLSDGRGRDRMFASYVKVRDGLIAYEHGAVEFDEESREWIKRRTWPEGKPAYPGGQAIVVDEPDGPWVYFARDLPNLRCRATPEGYLDIDAYEALTPLVAGGGVDRDAAGVPVPRWRRGLTPFSARDEEQLVRSGVLKSGEGRVVLRDVETGKAVRPHTSSLCRSPSKGVWSLIVSEVGGTSQLGEVWYAEADRPSGPWLYAGKVATHENYSFYNPRVHPYFAKDAGRTLYFEGTYTATFSGNDDRTPRYDYNQIMYRLDLADPRLNLPLPVRSASYYAPRRPGPGLIPLVGSGGTLAEPAVYLLAEPGKSGRGVTVPVLEYETKGGGLVHVIDPAEAPVESRPTGRAVGFGWPARPRRRD